MKIILKELGLFIIKCLAFWVKRKIDGKEVKNGEKTTPNHEKTIERDV